MKKKWSVVVPAGVALGMMITQASAAPRGHQQHGVEALSIPISATKYPENLPKVAPVADCSSLTKLDLTAIGGAGSQVTKASLQTIQGHQMCVVDGHLAPKIGFEVKLPADNWRQRFLQVGCGGLCGQISKELGGADDCTQINDGSFAMSTTDMGHEGTDGSFAKEQQLRADFAYRGVHLTAQATKALIKAFYGQDAKYSYFTGCSDGGREALMEAQRYPDDFNGIVAGAPAMNFLSQNGVNHPWLAQSNTGADGKPILLADKLPLIHKAVLDQCDALDGDKDGLISNPLACHPQFKSLLCKPGQASSNQCLTSQEVGVLDKVYKGPHDPKSGLPLLAGGPLPGSELAWAGIFVPASANDELFSGKIGSDANDVLFTFADTPATFDLKHMKFDAAYFAKLSKLHPFYDATNPDLHAFYKHGGKLILWHGLADQHISPLNTINYHLAVMQTMGKKVAREFERLYLFPGMYHCGSGEGPHHIDLISPMLAWVEQGTAPQAVLSNVYSTETTSTFGQPTSMKPAQRSMDDAQASGPNIISQSRPVYPYPATAVYNGHGDRTKAENYHPVVFAHPEHLTHWLGESFYRPYQPLN